MSGGSERFVDQKIAARRIVLWSKRGVPSCKKVRSILSEYALPSNEYEVCEIECRHDCPQIETYFLALCLASDREVK